MIDPAFLLTDKQLLDVLALIKHPTAIHVSEDAIIQNANDAMLAVWGKGKGVIGKTLEEALPELKGQPFIDMFKRVWNEGITISGTDTAADLVIDGKLQTFYFDFEYRAILNDEGKTYAILHTATDVTERFWAKQREEKLVNELTIANKQLTDRNEELAAMNEELLATTEELSASNQRLKTLHESLAISEERFKQLIQQAPVAICVIRADDLMIEAVNDLYIELAGKSREQLETRNIWEAIPEAAEAYAPVMRKVIETGIPFIGKEAPVPLVRNGVEEMLYLNFVYEPIRQADGAVTAVLVVVVDVTEIVESRRQIAEAEERTRLATEAAEIGTYEFNLIDKSRITSDRYNEIFGYDTAVTTEMIEAAIHPDDRELRQQALDDALKSGTLFYEGRFSTPDKRIKWLRVTGKVFYDSENKPLRMLGTILDITEFKRLQQQKDDFISIASHELKTPITSLKASLQLLEKMKDNPSKDSFNRIVSLAGKSIQRVSTLVEDLLNVSRLQHTQILLNKSVFNVAELLRTTSEPIVYNSKQKIVLTGDLGLEVNADEHRIEQVVANFISNAVKYAPESEEIKLTIQRNNGFARISVTDTGPGVPADKADHLFDRYFKVERTGYNTSGLGLGLYISAEIVKHHGGEIGVDSKLGEGSTFWFTLPLN